MDGYQAAYWAYFFLAAFSLGAMGFAGFLNFVAMRKFRLGFNSIACYRTFMSVGYCLTIGTLLWLTLPARTQGIPPSVGYFFYMVGLFSAGVGALGLAFKNIDLHIQLEYRESDRGEDNPDEGGPNGTQEEAPPEA